MPSRPTHGDLLPDRLDQLGADVTAEEQAVRVEIPGKIAHHLHDRSDLDQAQRDALQHGRTVRRGQGYSLHVTAQPHVHQALLSAAATLNNDGAPSAQRKAFRVYADRLATAIAAAAPM